MYLEKRELDVAKEGVAVISVHGKGNLAKWRRLFTAYEIPCYLIFDNDTGDDGNGEKRRDALRATGLDTAQQAQYVGALDWVVEEEFTVFGSDFEDALRQTFPGCEELEAMARAEGVTSKPFVARWVAERMPVGEAQVGWQRMHASAAAIRAKLPPI